MLVLEQILHSKKLNYQTLSTLIKPYMNNIGITEGKTVNIFIDFYNIIKPLYNPQILETLNTLKVHERFMIASEIINIVGHYRHFFYSRLHMFSNFIFYYSDKEDNFKTNIEPSYKETFYNKRLDLNHPQFSILNNIINKNVKLIKLFCEYVPHVYFINTGNIDPILVPYLFLSNESMLKQNIINKDDYSIIISNEKIQYQDLLLQDKILQLELRGKNKSKFITRDQIISILVAKNKNKDIGSILPDLYPLILSITGYKDYNVKGIKNMGNRRAINFLNKCIDEGYISNIQYNNEYSIRENLKNKLDEQNINQLINNSLLLNNNFYKFNNNDIIKIEMQLIDRIDAKSVRYINDKYFTRYPILLDFCWEGENYV